MAFSKTHPSALNYGTNGNGTATHLNMEAIKALTGLQAQHIPYKAAGVGTTDLMAGRLQVQAIAASVLLPHVRAGKMTAIAVISPQRLPQLPDVPTVAESLPGFQPVLPWIGTFVPAGTPAAIVNQIHADITGVLRAPDMADRFAALGLVVAGEGTTAFAKSLALDYDRLGKLVKKLGITVY